MKIIILTNHLEGTDGWSRYSLDIAKALKKSGHNVLCIVNKPSSQKEIKEIPLLGNPLLYMANPLNSYFASRKINPIIRKFAPNIIHVIAEPYATILIFLKFYKVVMTIHGTYSYIPKRLNGFRNKTSSLMTNLVYLKVDLILSDSQYTKEYLLNNYKKGWYKNMLYRKIKIFHNPTYLPNSTKISYSNNPIKKILSVCAIKGRKGLKESIKAIKYYKDNFSSDFMYYIIGAYEKSNKTYYNELLKLIKKNNLDHKVVLTGRLNPKELEKYYAKSDLFLLLPVSDGSSFEGFGLVYIEANAYGVPCIGTNDFGSKEAIKEGYSGYIVNPYKPKEIAKKINLVINDGRIRRENCFSWAKEHDVKERVKDLVKYYEQYI